MKTIKGSDQWSKQCECTECGALLEVEAPDVYEPKSKFLGNISYRCPECDHQNYIDESDVPRRIRDKILKEKVGGSTIDHTWG